MLATVSADNTVKLWNPATGKEIKTLTGHTDRVYGRQLQPGWQNAGNGKC
jgi:WD40 repeat protein